MKTIKYKGYEIQITIAVCYPNTFEIINEFDSIREAKKEYSNYEYDFYYLAAEIIDKDGNVNPACWGKTKEEALNKLKKALS